jgi:oligoribonuclease NrnB/cAMP/cGMP phosphodiesterase (DHH superfamily)
MSELKDTVIFYHADCYDGFGGAYAAYKKFENTASYIPLQHDGTGAASQFNGELTGKDIFMIDFCSSAEVMQDLLRRAKSLTVLDHHKSAEEVVKSIPNHRYALDHSGAYLAWEYFHPNTEIPKVILYIEDGDLWHFAHPHSKQLLSYIKTHKLNFDTFGKLQKELEDPKHLQDAVQKGTHYEEHWNILVDMFAEQSQEVEFQGHRILVAHAPRIFRSHVGNKLAQQKPPFSIVWYFYNDRIHCSLRSDKSFDVSKLAEKMGGGGHAAAAGFTFPVSISFPWTVVDVSQKKE